MEVRPEAQSLLFRHAPPGRNNPDALSLVPSDKTFGLDQCHLPLSVRGVADGHIGPAPRLGDRARIAEHLEARPPVVAPHAGAAKGDLVADEVQYNIVDHHAARTRLLPNAAFDPLVAGK